jgi:trans-aconitate 2-methyltransferase
MTEWNATAYNRLSNPMQGWGETIVEQLALRGDETALDLGCGSGRLTEFLLERLPRGHVIAVDRSANMLEFARNYLEPRFDGRVSYVRRSLDQLEFEQVAELAFSNAAFHWIPDHPRLFRSVFAALKPGGWLVAQCGAERNIARIRARLSALMHSDEFRPFFGDWSGPWEFASPELTAERLRNAGFDQVEISTFAAPFELGSYEETYEFFENVILGSHLERIPDAALRQRFVTAMVNQSASDTPPFQQDYWRMNIRAQRPPSGSPEGTL